MKTKVIRYSIDFKNQIISLNQNGMTYKQLQTEFGISSSSIANWKSKFSKTRQEIESLRQKVLQLEEDCLILSYCSYNAPLNKKLDVIYKLRSKFKLINLCRVLKVNRSTFYTHFFRPESQRTKTNRRIREAITQIYAKFDKRPGYRKIRYILLNEYKIKVCWKTVYHLMQKTELPKLAIKKPKFKHSTINTGKCFNYLQKKFNVSTPNMVWVSDITYLKAAGRLYPLCVIMDLYSRKIISYNISYKADANLVINTFNEAYEKYNPIGLMFHSDRGTQYNAFAFRKVLDKVNVLQSFSAKGHPYDNAVVESFFKFLKLEEANRRNYVSLEHLKSSISKYIDDYYNSIRPHGYLNFLSPNQAEENFYLNK